MRIETFGDPVEKAGAGWLSSFVCLILGNETHLMQSGALQRAKIRRSATAALVKRLPRSSTSFWPSLLIPYHLRVSLS